MLENVGLELIGYLSGNGNTGGAHVTEVLQEIQDAGDEQIERIEAAEENMAPVFSVSTAYSAGDYVLRDGVMYRFTADHAAGTWTGSDAVAVKAGTELTHLKQDITELETSVETKADIDGTYGQMTVGNAEQLTTDKGIVERVPYLLRASGGNGADREEDKIVGGTVAWNQQVLDTNRNYKNTSVADTRAMGLRIQSGSSSFNNLPSPSSTGLYNAIIRAGFTSSTTVLKHNGASVDLILASYISVIAEHKYLVSIKFDGIDTTTVNGVDAKNIQMFDLTQMFDTTIADRAYALEQATAGSGINWLKSMGFFRESYHPYDAGTLKSVEGLTAHSMVGRNLVKLNDGTYTVNSVTFTVSNGYVTFSGTASSAGGRNNRISDNFTLRAGTYYIKTNATNTNVVFYLNRVSDNSAVNIGDNRGFALSEDTEVYAGFNFVTGTNYTGVSATPTLNFGSTAMEYEPYVKHSYPLDSDLTLRGIPKLDANNQVYYDGDEYASDGTVTRRYGIVDLGTLNWTRYSFSGTYVFYVAIDGRKSQSENVVCAKYSHYVASPGALADKTMNATANGAYIYIRDDSYTDAATFKTAMSGVYLIYELATSTTEEAIPYTNPQILDPYGTEEYETTGVMPVGHETFYPENLRAKLEDLPASPTVNGDYILRRTNGVNTYATAPGMDVVTVSGSTVTQTGAANKFYVCGTLATLTFTAPSSGISGIRFTSGSTPTVLTVSGVTYWMNGFDPTSLEASKTYEISVLNGVGVVGC